MEATAEGGLTWGARVWRSRRVLAWGQASGPSWHWETVPTRERAGTDGVR